MIQEVQSIFVSRGLKDIVGEKMLLLEDLAAKKFAALQEVKMKCVSVIF